MTKTSCLSSATLALLGVVSVTPAAVFTADVTFARDIAPILQQKCHSCHRPGTAAPMSLLRYEEARPLAQKIKERVVALEMPPWHLSKAVGIQEFKNDRSLTQRQIDAIVAWADAGAPLGNREDLPLPLEEGNDDGWHIGSPDHIVEMPTDHVMYASGADVNVDYYADVGLSEDRYFKAVEIRVTKEGRRIVHHALAHLVEAETARSPNAAVNDAVAHPGAMGGSFLSEYALGKTGELFPEGTGRLLKAGSRIRFRMQYHAAGEEVRDRASIGFVFYPQGYVPKHRVENIFVQEIETIDIPRDAMARSEIYYPLLKPVRLVGFQPHMHLRGRAMCIEAIFPNGYRETLNCVDRFDPNWNIMYLYADDAAPLLPAGVTLRIAGIHDNTAENPRNPDPELWIGWGKRIVDEITAAHIAAVVLSEEEFRDLELARERKNVGSER